MPYFSQRSLDRLSTCHSDLQDLFKEVVKYYDCTILEGHRTTERQQELFEQGRTTPGKIVTYCDGITSKSRHQSTPSIAVDVAPYPIDWNNRERFFELAGFVQAFALGMNIKVQWGGHWKGKKQDLPHWELKP